MRELRGSGARLECRDRTEPRGLRARPRQPHPRARGGDDVARRSFHGPRETLATRSSAWSGWDLDKVHDADFRHVHRGSRSRRILFVHASQWTDPFPVAPDVTTVLYQQCGSRYDGGAMRVNPKTQELERMAPDPRPEGELAAEIVAAVPEDVSRRPMDVVLQVLRATKALPADAQLGLRRIHGWRRQQWAGGPVKQRLPVSSGGVRARDR